jgi:hypothetical protein
MNEEFISEYGKHIIDEYYYTVLYKELDKQKIINGKLYGIITEEDAIIIGDFIVECACEIFDEYLHRIKNKLRKNYREISNEFCKNLAIACTILAYKTITAHDWGFAISYDRLKHNEKDYTVDYDLIKDLEFDLMENTDYMSCRKVLDKMYKVKRKKEDPFLFRKIPEHLFKKEKRKRYEDEEDW